MLSHLGIDYLVRRSKLAEANIRRPQEFSWDDIIAGDVQKAPPEPVLFH